MTNKGKQGVAFYLEIDLYEKLHTYAHQNDLAMTEVVKEALREYFENK